MVCARVESRPIDWLQEIVRPVFGVPSFTEQREKCIDVRIGKILLRNLGLIRIRGLLPSGPKRDVQNLGDQKRDSASSSVAAHWSTPLFIQEAPLPPVVEYGTVGGNGRQSESRWICGHP